MVNWSLEAISFNSDSIDVVICLYVDRSFDFFETVIYGSKIQELYTTKQKCK